MKLKEANITISITDMDRAISFYTSLGFTEKIRWQNHYAKLVVDGVILGCILPARIPKERQVIYL